MSKKKILSALLAASVLLSGLSACGNKTETKEEATTEAAAAVTESEETAEASTAESETETESETEAETEHVSPTQTVTSELGYQLEVKKTIDHEKNKTYKASLKDFGIEEGDRIDSITFVFASDTVMDSYQGGWGISVTDDCKSATDDSWYQSDDFTENVNSQYTEITVSVPSDVAEHIDPTGQVLVGYWWGSAASVSLEYIILNDVKTAELPVDGAVEATPNAALDFNSKDSQKAKVKLSDMLKEGDVPQAVTYTFNAGSSFKKFTGAFGISLVDGCKAATEDNYYQTCDISEYTESSSLSLTWIIPEDIKEYIDLSGTVDLGYWYSESDIINLTNVSILFSNASGDISNSNKDLTAPSSDTAADAPTDGTMQSAEEIVSSIKVGWNLGNTLDSYDSDASKKIDETYWGNPKTTKEMIDSVKSQGFNAIRIPVTWLNYMDSNYKIDADWMARVKEVVDYAYDDGMYVILNTHHDEDWIDVQSDSSNGAIKTIWEQISEEFKDYDSRLIFEGMNELRTIGSANEWQGGTASERQIVNKYWQTFVDTVRASGGNNAKRALIVATYGQSPTEEAVNDLVVPSDDNIIVSVHSYDPYNFALNGNSDVAQFNDSDKAGLDAMFDRLKSVFISKGIPVLIDECGNIDKDNQSEREEHLEYFISAAKQRGIKCFYWDNGEYKTGAKTENTFAIFNRKDLSWNEGLVKAMMKGAS